MKYNKQLSGGVSAGQGRHVGADPCYPHLILSALLVPELYRGETLKWRPLLDMNMFDKVSHHSQGLHAVMH